MMQIQPTRVAPNHSTSGLCFKLGLRAILLIFFTSALTREASDVEEVRTSMKRNLQFRLATGYRTQSNELMKTRKGDINTVIGP